MERTCRSHPARAGRNRDRHGLVRQTRQAGLGPDRRRHALQGTPVRPQRRGVEGAPYTESGQDDPFTKRTISNNRATISGLSDGITYTFRIGAVTENGTIWYMPVDGTAGDDPPSTPERSPGTIPCAGLRMPPTMLTYSLSDTDVALTWTASTFPDVVSQKVRRRERGGGSTWTDFTVTTDATTWTDTTAVSGRTYIYRVQAPRPKTGQAGQMSNRQVVTIP